MQSEHQWRLVYDGNIAEVHVAMTFPHFAIVLAFIHEQGKASMLIERPAAYLLQQARSSAF